MTVPTPWHPAGLAGAARPLLAVLIGSNKPVGLAFWLAVIVALGTLEALAHLTRLPLPALEDLVGRYLRHPVARAAGVAVWLYAGWHLFSH